MSGFYEIPAYPEGVSGASVFTRMLDGLGFRFYWCTEGLDAEDYRFRPSPDSRSIEEIVKHVWGLMNWVGISVLDESRRRPGEIESERESVLEMIFDLRDAVLSMSDSELGGIRIEGKHFWHLINGPVSDALTHVGQVNSFRRLAGNPSPRARVFLGLPPDE